MTELVILFAGVGLGFLVWEAVARVRVWLLGRAVRKAVRRRIDRQHWRADAWPESPGFVSSRG